MLIEVLEALYAYSVVILMGRAYGLAVNMDTVNFMVRYRSFVSIARFSSPKLLKLI